MKAEKKTIICPHFFLLTVSQYLAGGKICQREREIERGGAKRKGVNFNV